MDGDYEGVNESEIEVKPSGNPQRGLHRENHHRPFASDPKEVATVILRSKLKGW